jgi:hypothetical protein
MSPSSLGCVKTQTRATATEETFVPIVDSCINILSRESDFSWPQKNHSRDFSIFCVFTQPGHSRKSPEARQWSAFFLIRDIDIWQAPVPYPNSRRAYFR